MRVITFMDISNANLILENFTKKLGFGRPPLPLLGTKVLQKTSQELRMLSTVTLNCWVTKIVMHSSSQLSESE